jgi:hypothetical protein
LIISYEQWTAVIVVRSNPTTIVWQVAGQVEAYVVPLFVQIAVHLLAMMMESFDARVILVEQR